MPDVPYSTKHRPYRQAFAHRDYTLYWFARVLGRFGAEVCHKHLADNAHFGRGHVTIETVQLLPVCLPGLPVWVG